MGIVISVFIHYRVINQVIKKNMWKKAIQKHSKSTYVLKKVTKDKKETIEIDEHKWFC